MHARMLGNPCYRAAGLLALPALLLFELLGPIIELSGYTVALAAWLTGSLSTTIFLLFLAVSVLYGLILSFGAIALEDASFGRHAGWDQLRKLLLFAVIENAGYRQLSHLWRIEGLWQLVRGGEWGAMERKGFTEPELDATLGGEVGLR